MKLLIFIQNFGNYSFVCNYCTVYCVKNHYETIELFFQNAKKLWRHYHSCFTDVSLFSQWLLKFLLKKFPLILEPLIPWSWLTPHFLAFCEIYILITHWWPVSIPKHQMELNHATWHFSRDWWETADVSKNITWKVFKRIIFENNNIIAFLWGVIHPNRTSCSKIRAI